MAYKCIDCGEIFDTPDYESYCFEDYNGVSSLFPDRHYGHYEVCPYCGSEEIRCYYDDEEGD